MNSRNNWVMIDQLPVNYVIYVIGIVNLIGAALLGVAYNYGLLDYILYGDETGMTRGMLGAFAITMCVVFWKTYQVNADINHAGLLQYQFKQRQNNPHAADAFDVGLANRLSLIQYTAGVLTGLGFLGTIVGVAIAFQHIPAAPNPNAEEVIAVIKMLVSGVTTALTTTMMGLAGSIWVYLNYHILRVWSDKLYTYTVG